MNNLQESKLKRNKVIMTVFDENKAEVDSIPALARHCARFTNVNSDIEKIHLAQAPNSKGITQGKNLLKDDVTEAALIVSGAIASMATEKGNADLFARMDLVPTHFKHGSVAKFIKTIDEIVTEAELASTELTEYGVTPDDVASFKELCAQFKVAATKPREATVKKSTATSTLEELFAEADEIIDCHFNKLMVQFKTRKPEFYKDYVNANNVENHGSRKATEPAPVTPKSAS